MKEWSTLWKLIWLHAVKFAEGIYTLTGSIVRFKSTKAQALQGLTVAIEPVQDLHGYDYPWPGGGGVNFLPPMVDGTYEGNGVKAVVSNGVATLSGTTTSSGNAFSIPLSESVTLPNSFYYHVGNSKANALLQPSIENSGNTSQNVSIALSPANRISEKFTNKGGFTLDRIRFWITNGVTISGTYAPMFCLDNTARSFSPYSNSCPISGWSEAKIWVQPTHDTTANPTATIDLGGTRYGGTLDVLTGVLTVTKRYFVADGVNIKTNGGYGASGPKWLPCITLSAADYGVWDTMRMSYLKTKPPTLNVQNDQNTADFGNACKIIALHIGTMQGTDGTYGYNSANEVHAAVNSYLQSNNLEVCYSLATPFTVQLTPEQVSQIVGENNVWSDAGDVTVTFKGKPIAEPQESTLSSLNLLLGGAYHNMGTQDDVSDEEALDIILGGTR